MNFPCRNKLFVGAVGALLGITPLYIAIISHTASTDIFVPVGPTTTFNDFTPSDRTGAPQLYNGAYVLPITVRPITGSPVYLLFVPRRMSKQIEIIIVARLVVARPVNYFATTTINIGYRTGGGPESNVMTSVAGLKRDDDWITWAHTVESANMAPEERGARRLVFAFPHDGGAVWLVREVQVLYRD